MTRAGIVAHLPYWRRLQVPEPSQGYRRETLRIRTTRYAGGIIRDLLPRDSKAMGSMGDILNIQLTWG